MTAVAVRSMTTDEFDAWMPGAIASYAADHERNGSRPAGQALEIAREEFAKLLPAGVATPHHYLLVGAVDGARVGMLWITIPPPAQDAGTAAFVYDVEVDEDKRGKGFGRGLMEAAEEFARAQGANAMKLHVFGDNAVAVALYESLGYQATNINMSKSLM